MNGLTDLHCHILPYVDDGAETLDEARAMLLLQQRQGVETVIATPHCRAHMFTSPEEEIQRQYDRLLALIGQTPELNIRLLLGREYYCDHAFEELLQQHRVRCLGGSRFVLMEFSARHSAESLYHFVGLAVHLGYRPVLAHAERYPFVQKDIGILEDVISMGAWVQVNAGSLLGEEGWRQKHLCFRLLRRHMIHLVSSDAHHPDYRAPNLGACARLIESKTDRETAYRILQHNPAVITAASAKERTEDETGYHQEAGAAL